MRHTKHHGGGLACVVILVVILSSSNAPGESLRHQAVEERGRQSLLTTAPFTALGGSSVIANISIGSCPQDVLYDLTSTRW